MGVNPAQNQDRKPSGALCVLCLAAVALLAGCGQSTQVWIWTGSPGFEGTPAETGSLAMPQPHARHAAPTDPGVAVFARPGFHAEDTPEASRRDGQIIARQSEMLPDRLSWPEASRPDLRSTRSVTTSRTPERWVYPDTRRERTQRRHHTDFRAW